MLEACLSDQNRHNKVVIGPHGEFKPIVMDVQ